MRYHTSINLEMVGDSFEVMGKFIDEVSAAILGAGVPEGVRVDKCETDNLWRSHDDEERSANQEEDAYHRGFEHAREMYAPKLPPELKGDRSIHDQRSKIPELDLKFQRPSIEDTQFQARVDTELAAVEAAVAVQREMRGEVIAPIVTGRRPDLALPKRKPDPDDPTMEVNPDPTLAMGHAPNT